MNYNFCGLFHMNLQIHFNLDGQHYDVGLKEKGGVSSQNKVRVGGVEYSLEGDAKGVELIQNLIQESTGSLSQVGKELKAKLWLAGAKDLHLKTTEGTHKIGLRNLTDNALIDIHKTIDSISLAMEEEYVFSDIARRCSEFLHKQLEEGAYDAISDLEVFAEAVTADIRLISKDKHIALFSNDRPVREKIESDISPPQLNNKSQYKASSDTYELLVGYLAEDPTVGYMDLRVFGVCKERNDTLAMKEDVAGRREAYLAAVEKLKSADTIIIDLRNNGGGDPFAVQLLCSLFIEEGLPLNRMEWRSKKGSEINEFNTLSHAELPKKNRLLDKKIYILIGPRTFSAAEEFSNNMKVLGRATIVGEPSGGGAHPGDIFQISEDLSVFIPTGRAVNPIQEGNWEGEGIIPDHVVLAGNAIDEVVSLIKKTDKQY